MTGIEGFINILPKLLYGIAGIFVVIAIIAFAIKLMHWVFPEKEKAKQEQTSDIKRIN